MTNYLDFLEDVETLKLIDRSGYRYFGIKDPESVAEHSFGVVWYALLLASMEGGVDRYKVLVMALIHDLAEARTGDIVQPAVEKYLGHEAKNRMEQSAFTDILSNLPDDTASEFGSVFEELIDLTTKEAIIVENADKLQLMGQVLRYESMYNSDTSAFWKFAAKRKWLPSAARIMSAMKSKRKREA